MNRTDAIEVLDAVENGMIKLGQSRDVWQNDLVYTALQGVRLLLLDAIKKRPETPKGDDQTPGVWCKDCVYCSGFGECSLSGTGTSEEKTPRPDKTENWF